MFFLFSLSLDTNFIIVVSKYQEKKVTAVNFIVFFVRKYTLICAYICLLLPIFAYIRILLPIFAHVGFDNGIIIDSCDNDCC